MQVSGLAVSEPQFHGTESHQFALIVKRSNVDQQPRVSFEGTERQGSAFSCAVESTDSAVPR